MTDFKLDSKTTLKSLVVLAISTPLFFVGCNYKTAKTSEGGGASPDALAAGTQPTFVQLSAQVLAGKCFTCHDGKIQTDLTSYPDFQAHAGDVRSYILLGSGEKMHMPPSGHTQLTSSETNAIVSWIDSGAPQNGQSASAAPSAPITPPAPSIPVPSFAELKSNIVDPKCVTCHAHAAGGRHDLSDYAHFKQLAAKVQTRILLPLDKKGHMPESDHAQLTNEELTTLVAWISQGSPEKGIGEQAPPVVATPAPTATPTPAPTATPVPPVLPPSATPTPVPGPIMLPPVMGFEQLKTSVLTAKCITCHNGADEDDFQTYEAFAPHKASVKKRVLAPASSDSHMPPNDHPQLTDIEIGNIVAWVDAGGPLNSPLPANPK